MPLIKSNHAPLDARPFSMKDIEAQAAAMLSHARQQADRLLAAAQTEAERLKVAARAEGFESGKAEGLAAGREAGAKAGRDQALTEHKAQLTSLVQALTNAAAELDRSRHELETAGLRDVLDLSIAIAERVTKKQGALDPSVAVANVAEAMKLVTHASDVRIAVHPGQKAVLADALPERQEVPT
jgi:flagellar assembly protein FliH